MPGSNWGIPCKICVMPYGWHGPTSPSPLPPSRLVCCAAAHGCSTIFDNYFVARSSIAILQAFTESTIETRNIERKKFGGTVSQVQPNIKRSPGGLRDLHLMRWIGFARYQVSQVDDLDKVWALAEDDVRLLVEARDFLTRIRCELHFQAGGPQDVLTPRNSCD